MSQSGNDIDARIKEPAPTEERRHAWEWPPHGLAGCNVMVDGYRCALNIDHPFHQVTPEGPIQPAEPVPPVPEGIYQQIYDIVFNINHRGGGVVGAQWAIDKLAELFKGTPAERPAEGTEAELRAGFAADESLKAQVWAAEGTEKQDLLDAIGRYGEAFADEGQNLRQEMADVEDAIEALIQRAVRAARLGEAERAVADFGRDHAAKGQSMGPMV